MTMRAIARADEAGPDATGFDLDDVTEETETCVVDFGGGRRLTVSYRPNVLTGVELRALKAGDDQTALSLFARLIAGWDLVRSGKPVPITAEALDGLDVRMLKRLIEAVMEDLSVPESVASSSSAS